MGSADGTQLKLFGLHLARSRLYRLLFYYQPPRFITYFHPVFIRFTRQNV